ncbi:MAG: hypothetical protein SGILL_004887 [Bacillariaceae sp.]
MAADPEPSAAEKGVVTMINTADPPSAADDPPPTPQAAPSEEMMADDDEQQPNVVGAVLSSSQHYQTAHERGSMHTQATTSAEAIIDLSMAASPRDTLEVKEAPTEGSAEAPIDVENEEWVPVSPPPPQEETAAASESVSALSASNAASSSTGNQHQTVQSSIETPSVEAAADNSSQHTGPPTSIIQQHSTDSASNSHNPKHSLTHIKLDSMNDDDDDGTNKNDDESAQERMSDVSDFHVATNGSNTSNLLNMDSSSGTSMGSQGSYAYQVPALSKSNSTSNRGDPAMNSNNNNSNSHHSTSNDHPLMQPALAHPPPPPNGAEEIDLAKGNVKLPPRSGEGLMMMNPPSVSMHSSEPPVKSPNNNTVGIISGAVSTQNSDLDDILGPHGEPMSQPHKSDLDEILGPKGEDSTLDKPSDLDDTLGPYEGEGESKAATIPSVESSSDHNNNYAAQYTAQLNINPLDTTEKRGSSTRLSALGVDVGSGTMAGVRTTSEDVSQFTEYPDPVDPSPQASRFTEYPDPVDPSPAITPVASEPDTPVEHMTPSMSRRAIDDIGKALANRSMEGFGTPTAHTSASILPEPSPMGATSTAYGTAMEGHGVSPHPLAPQSSTSSKGGDSRQEFFPRKAESVDSVEPASTFESRWTNRDPVSTLGGYESGSRVGETLSPDNQSSWGASTGGSAMSPGASEALSPSTRGDPVSPGDSDALSPGSRGDTLSPSTRASHGLSIASSQDDTYASSQRHTFSPHDDSTRASGMSSPGESSHSGSTSSQEDTLGTYSQTEHTRKSQFSSRSHFSSTSHTRDEYSTVGDSFSHDQLSPSNTEYTGGNATQFSFESGVDPAGYAKDETSRINNVSVQVQVQEETTTDESGGRMWERAQIEAKNSMDQPLNPKAQKFAETIMARTRSRADPDAVVENSSTANGDGMDTPTRSMVKLTTQEEVGMIERTAFARKRVRVVQLLGAGLLAFLVSFLGGFWLQSSCYFVSTTVSAGENEADFYLRFGLWKYSPVDSAFDGYSYCSPYDDDYAGEAPWVSRFTSNLALIGGAFSLLVLWIYLVFGRCNHLIWKGAVVSAGLSGILQLITLSIFAGPICKSGCSVGPGALVSIFAGCIYLFLAYEMHYNAPQPTMSDGLLSSSLSRDADDTPRNLVASLEMKDISRGAKAYVRRLTVGEAHPYPTLNQTQRSNDSPMGKQMLANNSGSYQPPAVFV